MTAAAAPVPWPEMVAEQSRLSWTHRISEVTPAGRPRPNVGGLCNLFAGLVGGRDCCARSSSLRLSKLGTAHLPTRTRRNHPDAHCHGRFNSVARIRDCQPPASRNPNLGASSPQQWVLPKDSSQNHAGSRRQRCELERNTSRPRNGGSDRRTTAARRQPDPGRPSGCLLPLASRPRLTTSKATKAFN